MSRLLFCSNVLGNFVNSFASSSEKGDVGSDRLLLLNNFRGLGCPAGNYCQVGSNGFAPISVLLARRCLCEIGRVLGLSRQPQKMFEKVWQAHSRALALSALVVNQLEQLSQFPLARGPLPF